MKSGARRRPWRILVAALLAAALAAWTPLLRPLAHGAADLQLRLAAARAPSAEVLVFDIDDASLAALKPHFGVWPYRRDVYALAVDVLRELGARAIAIDLVLADAGPADAALARAIARPGAPVVLAAAGLRHASDEGPRRTEPTVPSAPGSGGAAPAGAGAAKAHAWPMIALPTTTVWPGAALPRLGVITTPLDEDGVLRRVPLWHEDGASRLPVMPWAVHAAADAPALHAPPLDRDGAFWLPAPGAAAQPVQRPFTELAQVALGRQGADALRAAVSGRVVFIGSSALLADSVMTPSGQVSGTAALAQAYAALRERTGVRPPAPLFDSALVLVALVPALLAVCRARVRLAHDVTAAALALALLAALALAALWLAQSLSSWVPPLAALLAGLAMTFYVQMRGQAAARARLAHELAVTEGMARAKGAFLANVSHEIRTPLNALLGVAELLAGSELTPQQRLHVQIFRQSGQALHALINDLLDLSKIESGRLELLAEPFDLGACLEQLCHLMRPRAEDKGLSLHLRCAPGLPTRVVGDRLRLEQMLTNLLANAIKFTSRGEVTLRVSPEAEPARELRFEVIDTGIGIAPNKLERIFEPFAQADGHVAQAFGGTGLGLAITRNLASLMGGSVQVQSAPGRGSTFTLVLPLAAAPADASPAVDRALPAAAGAAAAPAQRPTAFARPLAVLLAEDNEINTYLFGAMLEGLPLTIEMAANGVIALEHLRRRGYDIAFLDVQMPGLDGLAVARELRALELRSGRARTPVVALTANAFASDVRAALDAGCDRHVPKPFSRALLVEAIAALVPASAAGFDQAHEAALPAAPDAPAALSGAAVRVDHDAALERMGGDPELHRRAIEHALVFLGHWLASFDQAVAEGSLRTAHRLAHDLKAVAGTLGAAQLVDHAAALEKSLYEPEPDTTPDAAALQRVRAVLPGVLAALAERHALR